MLLPGEAARGTDTDDEAAATGEAGGERPGDGARARLAALQDEAGVVYEAITVADAGLRLLAGRRVAAERVLRHDASRYEAASRALAAHDRARPTLGRLLATRYRAQDEWQAGRAPLTAALGQVNQDLSVSWAAVTEAKEAFAARVAVRSEAVTELRRLTAACAAVTAEIASLEAGRGPGPAEAAETVQSGRAEADGGAETRF
jgi:hypothetical protein